MSDTPAPVLTTEVRDHVFCMGLNRPEKRNSFTLQLLKELAEAFTAYEDDDQLWCALLFAHGEDFTTGLDLAEVGPAVAAGAEIFPPGSVDPMGLQDPRRSKPLVTAVQGWCLTVGVELLLASDIRLAADNTRFAQLEIKRGIMPFGGATLRFHQVCGWGNAMRWLLTGGEFDAAEAYRIGLVQEVCAPAELFDRALAMAQEVAHQAPLAVQESFASARTALELGPDAALVDLHDRARGLMTTEDAKEGMMSFIERREAVFKGK